MKAVIDNVTIECIVGDITAQADIDAVVNAANAKLLPGGGVAGAIHAAAGPGLAEECRPLAPIRPGDAAITSGQRLPNAHIVHCLGPVYGRDEPADTLLADCYRNALRLAEQHRLGSIAFPAISTGAFGYPMAAAAEVALRTLSGEAQRLGHVRLIRLVLANKVLIAPTPKLCHASLPPREARCDKQRLMNRSRGTARRPARRGQ